MASAAVNVLDDPVRASLVGRHGHLSDGIGRALRYRPDVASFVSLPPDATSRDWEDLARLLGPGGFADLFSAEVGAPDDWSPVFSMSGVQMVRGGAPLALDDRVVPLGPDDVGDMLALVERTRPGPFWQRTIEMGRFHGIREAGALVAMAGERLRPPDWVEISGVCTAPEARGRGLAAAVVAHAVAVAEAPGDGTFLHVADANAVARELYERLGFEVRRRVEFRGFTVPDAKL